MIHIYRLPVLTAHGQAQLLEKAKRALGDCVDASLNVEMEYCFNVRVKGIDGEADTIPNDQLEKLLWLITETFEPQLTRTSKSFLAASTSQSSSVIIEVGPRLAFSTAWSSNCVSMCQACGIDTVQRVERSRRYKISSTKPLTEAQINAFAGLVHDRMTECVYECPLQSFISSSSTPEPVKVIPLLERGRIALEEVNQSMGLGFDEWDLNYYTKMFTETLQRNPTDVECFDLGQSNSEHSRHWFFGGKMIIDGEEKQGTLFSMVKSTLPPASQETNSVIAFHDNSSAIQGFPTVTITPLDPSTSSPLKANNITLHPILTAETHNFPCGVAPFAGAETGTGGRLRDVQATGRGAHTLAGVSAYCVGNLHIPGHPFPWEDASDCYSSSLATPLEIIIEASNGASDYGNKYGEPAVSGFCRTFGQRRPGKGNDKGERVEWIKPIMFTAGAGWLDSRHSKKGEPEPGMVVCKVGGPAYRIGMGGGAASSRVQSSSSSSNASSLANLDFNAVQRGDAEMENRMNRVIRACVEMGDANPIVSIHDQGAGGNGNVLKELVEPHGANYEIRDIPVGDSTLSVKEIWGAEYQENDAFLVKEGDLHKVLNVGKRENCPVSPVGVVANHGRVIVHDKQAVGSGSDNPRAETPFDMPLSLVLGKMPQKTFSFKTPHLHLLPLDLPQGTTVDTALQRVLQLVDVGSKRFLTNKVDRSVTGLIAQQQCVGPLHTPLSNVAVLASSHFTLTGMCVSVGEQPIKGLLNPAAQARMTVGEAITNLVWGQITALRDVKASGNWMWAAKMEGEGAKMWEACEALKDALIELGPSIDGGKDSLSMAARVDDGEVVKSPGQLTLTCYAACPDITLTITPDMKMEGGSVLLFIDLGNGRNRLGGSALSTVYNQLGNESPDCNDMPQLKRAFDCVQRLGREKVVLSGHDRSDGGLIVCVLEMAMAGNVGVDIELPDVSSLPPSLRPPSNESDAISRLFGEELGLVLEVRAEDVAKVTAICNEYNVPLVHIGHTRSDKRVTVKVSGEEVISNTVSALRDQWESTSFLLEQRQCDAECVASEKATLRTRKGPRYVLETPSCQTSQLIVHPPDVISAGKHRVAVIRQEGSNGDREMLAAVTAAGCEGWDVNMRDLVDGRVTLDRFNGVIFCGGFSYADVNDSAKGWAGVIKFNSSLTQQFKHFRETRKDTFTLGVCNGCQLMALLGWVPFSANSTSPALALPSSEQQPRFVHNTSGRFESRWSCVKILPSPSVLLKGMEGLTLGIWVAHGEGRALFPNDNHLHTVLENGLAPIRYVDDDNNETTTYPMNPNGSPHGIAALCSEDGRSLAMMPHPERCYLQWQWPHKPSQWHGNLANQQQQQQQQQQQEGPKVANANAAPWLKMFINAKAFCDSFHA